MAKINRKLISKILYSAGPQIITGLVAIASVRIYSEILAPIKLGNIMLGIGIIALLDAVFSAPINQSFFYYSSKLPSLNCALEKISSNAPKMFKYGVVFLMPILLIGASKRTEGLVLVAFVWILFLGGYILIEYFRAAGLSILNLSRKTNIYGFQIVFDSAVNFSLTSIFLYFRPELAALLGAVLLSRMLSLFAITRSLLKLQTKFDLRQKNAILDFSNITKYARSFSLMGIIGWGGLFLDRYVIDAVLGRAVAGVYSVCSGLAARPYNIVSSALTVQFRPDLYLAIDKNHKEADKVLKKWIFTAVLLVTCGSILIFLLRDYIVQIMLAKEYRESGKELIPIVAASCGISTIVHAYDNSVLATGKAQKLLLVQALLIPLSAAVILISGFFFGVLGAAYARIVNGLISLLAMHSMYIKLSKNSPNQTS
jgi:Polysaccharide biosynthesis protein